jgi:AcrR family transcriptional regulator
MAPTRSPSRRTRGERAGLSLDLVVRTACRLDRETLGIQAVADELGVDRKAIHHYVADRETLLTLVAEHAFASHFLGVDVASCERWQDACRAHAAAFTDAVVATGTLAQYLDLSGPIAVRLFVDSLEAVLERLVEAGLDDEQAVRCVALLTNICLGYARDTTDDGDFRERRPALLHEALSGRNPADVPVLRRVDAAPLDTYDRTQLDLGVEVFIAGVEALLMRRDRVG